MEEVKVAWTYNQDHKARQYAKGRRRVSAYIAWSYPAEANRNPAVLDNRFSKERQEGSDVGGGADL
jgi:hypothetical protein